MRWRILLMLVIAFVPALSALGQTSRPIYLPMVYGAPQPIVSTPVPTSAPVPTAVPTSAPVPTAAPQRTCANPYPLAIPQQWVLPDDDQPRRVYAANEQHPDGLIYLAWRPDDIAPATFAAALTGDGTYARGFQEAQWRDTTRTTPVGYPIKPGALTISDWVAALPATALTPAAWQALADHVQNQTILTVVGSRKHLPEQAAEVGLIVDIRITAVSAQDDPDVFVEFVYVGISSLPFCTP